MKLILYLLVILCCIEIAYSGSECSSYTVLNARDRSQKISNDGNNVQCDSSLSQAWYRFRGDAGYAMPTSCVPTHRCDTHASGWMQGSHPTQAEGIVTRTVCYHWSSSCCNWSNNIRVRNCGSFYVYELVPPPACSLRYCGNARKDCYVNPCLNGGTCHDAKGYRCECPYGFTGQQCETNVTTTVTCGEDYMQINLTRRHFPDVDWRNLHLNDKSCRATVTANIMNLRTPLNGCGTTYREHDNKIAFWNEVNNDGHGHGPGNRSTITRGKNLVIPFYCEYGREKIVSTNFSPSKKVVYASEGSFGNFTFTMNLYQTSSYTKPYSPFAYPVVVYANQPLWVQYEVKNTNADLVVFAENCRATPSNDADATPQHVFLQRGCAQGCISGSRKRRETADVDGSKAYDLSAGPFRKTQGKTGKQAGEGPSKANLPLIGGLAAVGGILLIVTILLSVKMLRNRPVPANVARPPADVTVNSYEQQGVEQDEQGKSNA